VAPYLTLALIEKIVYFKVPIEVGSGKSETALDEGVEKNTSLVADYEDKSPEKEELPLENCETAELLVSKQLFTDEQVTVEIVSKIEIEEACADFKVDAIIAKNCFDSEDVKIE
jgi:hypothetical protein